MIAPLLVFAAEVLALTWLAATYRDDFVSGAGAAAVTVPAGNRLAGTAAQLDRVTGHVDGGMRFCAVMYTCTAIGWPAEIVPKR